MNNIQENENEKIFSAKVKTKVKIEIYGEEIISKTVTGVGNSGRIYLPPTWVNHSVKVVRID